MLTIEFLPAKHGDSFLVRWGTPERLLLVDGGPDTVYEDTIRPHLIRLSHRLGGPVTLDAVCVSHVDDDHVVGIIRLLKELVTAKNDGVEAPFRVNRLWFNSVDDLIDHTQPGLASSVKKTFTAETLGGVAAASFSQGSEVRDRAAALGLAGNVPFGAPLTTGMSTDFFGLRVTVVGPSEPALTNLVQKWQAAMAKKDPAAIANAYRDRSVPNLSSIALHIDLGGRTALLSGDARGDHLINGLERTGLVQPGKRTKVDIFKLPHHGSENNADPKLFDRIHADHYVICADGVKHRHPSPATLEWLVDSRASDDRYSICLTEPNQLALAELTRLAAGRKFSISVGHDVSAITLA